VSGYHSDGSWSEGSRGSWSSLPLPGRKHSRKTKPHRAPMSSDTTSTPGAQSTSHSNSLQLSCTNLTSVSLVQDHLRLRQSLGRQHPGAACCRCFTNHSSCTINSSNLGPSCGMVVEEALQRPICPQTRLCTSKLTALTDIERAGQIAVAPATTAGATSSPQWRSGNSKSKPIVGECTGRWVL